MKKDASKKPNEEQPKDAQPVAAAETLDTQSPSGDTVEGPDNNEPGQAAVEDIPHDGPGCEAVTVVVIARDAQHGQLAARSVVKNLKGADMDVHVLDGDHLRDTDIETLLEHLPWVKTERIILMTEGVMLLNPVTICDIGVMKTPASRLPALFHKTALEDLLPWLKKNLPHADVATEYQERLCAEVRPLELGDWRTDPWLLPVISENPSRQVLDEYGQWKKFIHVSPRSWTPGVIAFLEEKLAE